MLLLLTAFGSPLTAADAEHIDRCIAEMSRGDTGALAKVYERTHAALYGFSLFLLKNPQDAEDAVQETFVKAYQSAAQYRSQGKPMAWLITITRNLCMEKLRERGKRSDIPEEDWDKYLEQTPASPEDRLVLEQCLKALDDSERQIVILHAVGGMKHRETAELLGLPLATVLSKYSRAIKKLKSKLEKREGI